MKSARLTSGHFIISFGIAIILISIFLDIGGLNVQIYDHSGGISILLGLVLVCLGVWMKWARSSTETDARYIARQKRSRLLFCVCILGICVTGTSVALGHVNALNEEKVKNLIASADECIISHEVNLPEGRAGLKQIAALKKIDDITVSSWYLLTVVKKRVTDRESLRLMSQAMEFVTPMIKNPAKWSASEYMNLEFLSNGKRVLGLYIVPGVSPDLYSKALGCEMAIRRGTSGKRLGVGSSRNFTKTVKKNNSIKRTHYDNPDISL